MNELAPLTAKSPPDTTVSVVVGLDEIAGEYPEASVGGYFLHTKYL